MTIGPERHGASVHETLRPRFQRSLGWMRQAWLALLAPWLLAACEQIDSTLIDDRALVWLAGSLLGIGLVGGIGVYLAYWRRLQRWNLADSPLAPDSSRERTAMIGGTLIIALLFALYNLFADIGIPPDQQWANILAWVGGSVLGGFGAFLGGLRLAFGNYRRLSDSGGLKEDRPLLKEES